MDDLFVNLFWWAIYALPVLLVAAVVVFLVRGGRRRSADRAELEQLRRQRDEGTSRAG